MFNIGDVVKATGNPYDEQLGEFITELPLEVIDIKDVSDLPGTSGQWIKVKTIGNYPIRRDPNGKLHEYNDWIDAAWFTLDTSVRKEN